METETPTLNGGPDLGRPVKRVLAVEDHPLLRQGVEECLRDEPDLAIAAYAATAGGAQAILREQEFDCVLLDLAVPGAQGVSLVQAIRAAHPDLPILVFSMHDELLYAVRAVQAGATGYVTKLDPPEALLE